jgi:dihydropteroate synthase
MTRILAGRRASLTLDRPRIMGILNVTPDSFSDGGQFQQIDRALRRAEEMVAEGADLIDVGGESTRPGAALVSAQEEMERIIPVIVAIRARLDIPLSVDTNKAPVAAAALESGADWVNDVSGLSFDASMAAVVAAHGGGLFLMHTRGTPAQMQQYTHYDDIVAEVIAELKTSIATARAAGIPAQRLAIDPGIGFAKDLAGNLELLRRLDEFKVLDLPILLGTSRKSFIGKVLQQPQPMDRLYGTLATVALGVAKGAMLLRVHDVRAARETALMSWAILQQS